MGWWGKICGKGNAMWQIGRTRIKPGSYKDTVPQVWYAVAVAEGTFIFQS